MKDLLKLKSSLTQEVENILNAQIKVEAHSSALYLAMSSWCDDQGLDFSSDFFAKQSNEEREHMLKLFKLYQQQRWYVQFLLKLQFVGDQEVLIRVKAGRNHRLMFFKRQGNYPGSGQGLADIPGIGDQQELLRQPERWRFLKAGDEVLAFWSQEQDMRSMPAVDAGSCNA
ncbi:hypothetical protein FQR65_LT17570 [Abscondita terminalis]|nr:hypothetical protein FQR65_LT17570 [Abscondita terminalis]